MISEFPEPATNMASESWKPLPRRLVGVSLKMYFDLPETKSYVTALSDAYIKPSHPFCGIFVLPSLPALTDTSAVLSQTPHILLGAQNSHWEDSGAYTGEVSPKMLKQIGCAIVEMGHAERRRPPFNEDNEMTARKAVAAVRNGLIPLVCIGEKSKSAVMSQGVGAALLECTPQITAVLNAIPSEADVIFAYEPIWAIGAQEPASADHVLTVVRNLKSSIQARNRSGEVRILYGGSAQPGTWNTLKEGVDGLFLGRFAHDIEALKRVVEEVGME